ncbi:MAG: deoxyribodipyrimidine photo-lyase, partial [Caulobacteraceae bacterium]
RRGDPAVLLPALVRETGAALVYWNRSFEPLVEARDEELADALGHHDVEVRACDGALLQPPGRVRTQGGEPYKVFTPFWRTARGQLGEVTLHRAPQALIAPEQWPSSETLKAWKLSPTAPDWSKGFGRWTPGEAGAKARLHRLTSQALETYPDDRDRPALEGGSRLSPHLAWGEIGPRQVMAAVERAVHTHPGLRDQADKFLAEIGWREFNYNLLDQQPRLATRNFRTNLDAMRWRRDRAGFEAWSRGRTGYPLVDAGMRQLWTTGWMHNRVRMVAASFLAKHLLIDWREGEAWFWDCLVDADPANNPGNWQWSAGVGADAQPFFRIFNPVAQGEKFDPDGAYVGAWVPELAGLEARYIHAPWTAPREALAKAGVILGESYPEPIVAHEAARRRALDALREARADD